jgi:hypothetical protein
MHFYLSFLSALFTHYSLEDNRKAELLVAFLSFFFAAFLFVSCERIEPSWS